MAHSGQEYVLVGYSEDLERKPLKFVEPIPSARICSACGDIPRLKYTLYVDTSSANHATRAAPQLGSASAHWTVRLVTRDVTSKEYPAESLLRRKVHCWNEVNGCSVVRPASLVAEHVRHDCQYHVTRCPTCLAAVLNRDVCAHLRSECTELVLHAAPEARPRADNSERAHLVGFEKRVEQRVGEVDFKLAKLSLETTSLRDELIEVRHSINYLKEALTEQFGTASVRTLHRLDRSEADMKAIVACDKTTEQRLGELDTKLAQLSLENGSQSDKILEICSNINHFKEASDRNVAEIKALYSEQRESLMTEITSVLLSAPSDTKTHQRVITGYAALKEEALEEGWSSNMSDNVYLRRYLMSWGIGFKEEGDSVHLYLWIQLHEGIEDDFLDWPFTKELKLSIIHPKTRQERHLGGRARSSESVKEFYARPIGKSNLSGHFGETRVKLNDIERDGYVKKDQLLVRFEVLL